MIRSIPRHFRLAGLMLAVLVAAGQSLKADEYTVGVNTSGAATATISFTGNGGIDVYTVPFSATDTTTGSAAFAAFCVDLYHDQPLGTSTGETGPAYSIASLAGSSILSQAVPNTGYSDLASRLNYMGSVYHALTVAGIAQDPDVAGAFQLALWSLLDSNFKVVSFNGDAVLSTDTSLLITLLGGAKSDGSGGGPAVPFEKSNGLPAGVNVAAYSLAANYSSWNGQLVLLHPTPGSPGLYQNLLTWGQPSLTIQSVAPEPSSFAFAGLGALAFAGYTLRRRARA